MEGAAATLGQPSQEPGGASSGTEELSSALAPEHWADARRSPLSRAPTFVAGEELARRYRVEHLLARGGMGEVFQAFDCMLHKLVALKTLPATQSDDPGAVARLLREARHARRVRHPNVCRVYDMLVHEENPRDVLYFLVMDLVAGESLRRYARSRLRPIAGCLSVARQILFALAAVHAAGLIHRDVKSDNLLVRAEHEPFVTLIDFGLSRPLQAAGTVIGSTLSGSFGYMAPEQLEGRRLSPRTDLFSFGVVLFELLTGVAPFQCARGRVTAHAWTAPEPSRLRAEIPPELDVVVGRCLRRAQEERYASAGEVLAVLPA